MAVSVGSYMASAFILCFGTYISGVLSIVTRKALLYCDCTGSECKPGCRTRCGKLFVTFLIYFSGGVLLSLCMLFLLPVAVAKLEPFFNAAGEDPDHSYAFIEFTVCCGFFMAYFLDELIRLLVSKFTKTPAPTKTRAIHWFVSRGLRPIRCPSQNSADDEKQTDFIHVPTIAILTVITLSFHSFFEGYTLGNQKSEKELWVLFAGIAVYKFVMSFVVGLEVLNCGNNTSFVYIYCSIFAATTPLGMTVAVVTNASEQHTTLVGMFNAVAIGTLLFIVFCEILQRQNRHHNLKSWQELLACMMGFFGMSALRKFYK